MSTSKKNSPKTFDQTVCFTCFAPWVESIRDLSEHDPQTALTAFFILADFCLYGIEPDPENNPWGFTWPVVSGEARRSINNRRRGFGAEDTALTKAILEYRAGHPSDTQKQIADALHCSAGKVNKVLRSVASGSDIHNDSNNDIAVQGTLPKPCFLSAGADEEIFGLPTSADQKGGDAE